MKVKQFIYLLLIVSLASCISKKNTFYTKDYFPLSSGDTLIYQGSYNDKKEIDTLIISPVTIQNRNCFIHLQPQNISGSKILLVQNHFGPGLYRYDWKGNLYSSFVLTKFGLDTIRKKDFFIFLPKKISVGYRNTIINPEKTKQTTLIVDGIEDLVVNSILLKNCIKIRLEEFWPKHGNKLTAFVWLQKNEGVVKWIRTTNRVEELLYRSK
ncbi:MAG: hypothetical protein JNJ40_01275 [Bacteroidia bacterium]|nr:hypothetical protein [Bacteroidia bacterium]